MTNSTPTTNETNVVQNQNDVVVAAEGGGQANENNQAAPVVVGHKSGGSLKARFVFCIEKRCLLLLVLLCQ